MKQLSVFVFMLAFCLTGNAGNLMPVKGGVDCLKNADKVMIELDCSKATYLGDNSFSDFSEPCPQGQGLGRKISGLLF